jgi:hypothetical protein
VQVLDGITLLLVVLGAPGLLEPGVRLEQQIPLNLLLLGTELSPGCLGPHLTLWLKKLRHSVQQPESMIMIAVKVSQIANATSAMKLQCIHLAWGKGSIVGMRRDHPMKIPLHVDHQKRNLRGRICSHH